MHNYNYDRHFDRSQFFGIGQAKYAPLSNIQAEKKRRTQCGYLTLAPTPKSTGYLPQSCEHNQFLTSRQPLWKLQPDTPNVFSLNKASNLTLLGSVQHLQQSCETPFGLNFEIPKISDLSSVFTLSMAEKPREAEPQEDVETTLKKSTVPDFLELVQECNISKARYWEDLTQECKQLVEVTPIHLSKRMLIDGVVDQYFYVEQIQQMLLGFQNQHFIFDVDQLQYKQNQIAYVEDMTCLKEVEDYFMAIATFHQQLKIYLLKPSMNKLNSKIKTLIQGYLDEFQDKLLRMQILQPKITLMEMYLQFTGVKHQFQNLCQIFVCDDNNKINQLIYEKISQIDNQSDYLYEAFKELINFQLQDLQRGINTQEFDIYIPQFFPSDFVDRFTNSVQGIALINQLKNQKVYFIQELVELLVLKNLQLEDNLQLKFDGLQLYYNNQSQAVENLRMQFKAIEVEQENKLKQIRRLEVQQIQENLKKQVEIQKKQNDQYLAAQLSQQHSLIMQIEINRINKKYQKLFEQQEERELLLEQEIKEKQKLQQEKNKLLEQLQNMEGQYKFKGPQDQIVEEPKQAKHNQDQELTIKERIKWEKTESKSGEINEEHPMDSNQQNEIAIQEPIIEEIQSTVEKGSGLPKWEIVERKPAIIYDDNPSIQLKLEICLGMHGKLHNKLINQVIHFLLFDQLKILSVWDNIKAYYFTEQGDLIDGLVFSFIDNTGWFTPFKLTTLDLNPRLEPRHKFCMERQEFSLSNLLEQVQLKIDSNAQLLQACFPQSVLGGILMFFNFIIKLRYASFNLRKRWKRVKNNKYGLLRYQMQQFVDLYQNYIYCNVIESNYQKLMAQLEQAQSLNEVLRISNTFVTNINAQSLIKSDKRSIKDAFDECMLMINQFIQIIDYQSQQNIEKLAQNFRYKSEFFKMQIKIVKNDLII